MGVKDLWTILDQTARDVTLGYIQGKSVAIDLSGWVCDSQAMGQNHRSIQRPDLRNTFFRASRLLLADAIPLFVLEGEAPELKHATIQHRNASQRPHQQPSQHSQKPRSAFNSRLKPMLRLLDAMGLSYVQSYGEAEKLCAYLNKNKMIDTVVSQDSDCLLYGACEVLRHFSITGTGVMARCYSSSKVSEHLNLDRNHMVVLALLLGCDYCPQGVPGVGKDQAMTFLAGFKGNPLSRIRSWRHNTELLNLEKERLQLNQARTCNQCWHAGTARKHADRGCSLCHTTVGCTTQTSVLQENSAQSKWQIMELQIRAKALTDPNFPNEEIIDEFLLDKDVYPYIQVKWKQPDVHKLLEICTVLLGWPMEDCLSRVMPLATRWHCQQLARKVPFCDVALQAVCVQRFRVQQGVKCAEIKWEHSATQCCTLEPLEIFSKAYPQLLNDFEQQQKAAKETKRKAKPKKKKEIEVLDEMMENLDLDENLDESIPEHELSDIISTILSRASYQH